MQKTYSLCFPPAFRRNTTSSFVYAGFNFFFFFNGRAKNIPICHNCSVHSQDHYKLLWQKPFCHVAGWEALQRVVFLVSFVGRKSRHQRNNICTQPKRLKVLSCQQPSPKKTLAAGALLYRGQAFYRVWGTVMLENDKREAKIEWKHTSTAH